MSLLAFKMKALKIFKISANIVSNGLFNNLKNLTQAGTEGSCNRRLSTFIVLHFRQEISRCVAL